MYGEEVYYDYEGNQIIPVTEEGKREYCKDGFYIRGKKGRQGVFSQDGTEILPCKYRSISISDGFIIASHGSEGNSRLRDELYLTDGTLVFNDIYRNVNIKDGILTRNTPLGKEYYYVEKTE